MSTHKTQQYNTNVETYLAGLLVSEEENLVAAEEEVIRCTNVVEHCKRKVCSIKVALQVLNSDEGFK